MNNGVIGISFKKMFDGKADTVNFIGIESPESDSVFYSFTSATAIQLPLNQFATQTSYTLEEVYNENFLVMNYANSPVQFVSEDCGTRFIFSDLEFTDHNFDSLKIVTQSLTNSGETNLEVYRCPRTNLAKVRFRQEVNLAEQADTVYLNSISADFSTIFFIPNDTLTSVNLPLNPDAASTTFNFNFKDGTSKSLTLSYLTTPWDEFSSQCGTLKLFSEMSLTATDFTTFQITKDSIQDPPITNAEIFK
jgi:hypothetical protein